MDQLTKYRQLIKKVLCEYERLYNLSANPNVESFVVFDEERDHYLLMRLGWANSRRIRQTVLHVRIRNGKFWIEEEWTENGIATDLLRAGVPHQDIVLAFHPPEVRPLTEFAVA